MALGRERLLTRLLAMVLGLATMLVLLLLPVGSAQAAQGPGRAVVLVSGFDTITPFSTSNPGCAGQEGPAWSPAGGVAATLRANGYSVFTAPVMQGGGTPAAPCAPGGTPTPPLSLYINSNGDVNANGAALGGFLNFLRINYGITTVDFVAHSDGGLWSRAAITQQSNYPGLTVGSLTTLGTPHTGSFIADLSEDFSNGQCKANNQVAQLVCLALQKVVNLVITDLGELATEELTSDFLATWNPEQRIGACPVAGIAGTFFDLPLPPNILPAYYNPSDGLVGEASAHAQASKTIYGSQIPAPGIPNFVNAGSFPVVHGTSFSFLSPANLLNQQTISNAVSAALAAVATTTPTCTVPQPPTPTDGLAAVKIPLYQYIPPRRGSLPRPRKGDQILHSKKKRILCRRKQLRNFPFLGNPSLRVSYPRCKKRLQVKGKGPALLIRTRGTATIRVQGTRVTVSVGGVRVRSLALQIEGAGGGFASIPLNRTGRGTLPAGTGPTSLRVNVVPRRGGGLTGSATVSR